MPQVSITDLRAWPLRQPRDGRSYVVIRVDSDAGVSGWGEAPPGTDPVAAARSIEALKPQVLGRDALAPEALFRALGPAAAGAQGALGIALSDLLGKIGKAPVYELLSGRTRDKCRAMAALQGAGEEEWLASLKSVRAAGFRAALVPLTIPDGPLLVYRDVRRSLERLREAGGGEVDFALDCGSAGRGAAKGLSRELETFHLLWLEAPALEKDALAEVSADSAMPLGHGRSIRDTGEFRILLASDAIDVLRPDIAQWGIAPLRRAAAVAEMYYAAVAPSNAGGPIATAAALQVAASIPNFVIQEVPLPAHEDDRKMRREIAGPEIEAAKDGWLSLPTGPGLGITVDPDALARYRIPG